MSCRNTEKLVCNIFVSSFSCASSLFLFGNQTNGILFLGNVVKSSNGCIKSHDASFASKIKLNIFSSVSTNSIYSMKLSIFRLETCTESNGICHLEHIATLMSYVNDTTFWWTKQANNAIFHANCSVTKTQFQTFLSCWIVFFYDDFEETTKSYSFWMEHNTHAKRTSNAHMSKIRPPLKICSGPIPMKRNYSFPFRENYSNKFTRNKLWPNRPNERTSQKHV